MILQAELRDAAAKVAIDDGGSRDARSRAEDVARTRLGTELTPQQIEFIQCLRQRLDLSLPSHAHFEAAWGRAWDARTAPHIVAGSDEAEAEGFASFNRRPHLLVTVPDGGFTITAKTSQGKRVTFAFEVYEDGGPPQFVDVAYHDNGTSWDNGGRAIPTFDIVAMAGGRTPFDSRSDERTQDRKPSLVCVLMEDAADAVEVGQ